MLRGAQARLSSPDLIFTHHRDDLHQDHRLVSELTWNTFRDHLVLEYEIPKYDGDLGTPNVFVQLERGRSRERKVDVLMRHFGIAARASTGSPRTCSWRCLRLRGMESNAPSGYAEAFYCRKRSSREPGGHRRRAGGPAPAHPRRARDDLPHAARDATRTSSQFGEIYFTTRLPRRGQGLAPAPRHDAQLRLHRRPDQARAVRRARRLADPRRR